MGLKKYELGWKILTEMVVLRPKACSYFIDDFSVDKRANGANRV